MTATLGELRAALIALRDELTTLATDDSISNGTCRWRIKLAAEKTALLARLPVSPVEQAATDANTDLTLEIRNMATASAMAGNTTLADVMKGWATRIERGAPEGETVLPQFWCADCDCAIRDAVHSQEHTRRGHGVVAVPNGLRRRLTANAARRSPAPEQEPVR
mgnify:CR=1 FL=1